jgi:hypothetical protein
LAPHQPLLNLARGRPPQQREPALAAVGAWVREHTGPGDEVFAWVDGGLLQAVAGRRSPSRYFNSHFVTTDAAVAEVRRDLTRRPPAVIVVQDEPPAWLGDLVASGYVPVHRDERLVVYARAATSRPGPARP